MKINKAIFAITSTIIFLIIYSSTQLSTSTRDLNNISKKPTTTPTTSINTTSPTIAPTQTTEVKSSQTNLYTVIKVIDGDTISVLKDDIKETIRLIGINTPETVDPRRPVECFGKQASEKAKELLNGQLVALVEDPTQGSRDKYNRLLRYVFRSDGLFYNLWMVQNGYAYEYTYDLPYKYRSQFIAAQEEAQNLKKGLWGDMDCRNSPKEFKESSVNSSSDNTTADKDCRDFQTHNEAQEFFISQGGPTQDSHKLDSDGDGLVCESLP